MTETIVLKATPGQCRVVGSNEPLDFRSMLDSGWRVAQTMRIDQESDLILLERERTLSQALHLRAPDSELRLVDL
jgi:hypothetical protein